MLKKILEDITTVDMEGVKNIIVKPDESVNGPGDKRNVPFNKGDLVMVNELMVGKVQSVKGDDVQVLYKDGKVTTVKMGDVTNIAVKE